MGWYDIFASFYDRSLEPLYRDAREKAAVACRLAPGQRVLDLPTGTGQSLDYLVPGVGQGGAVVGVDASAGMLARAEQRVQKHGWSQVELVHSDVHALDSASLGAPFDCVHVFLGLSAFPRWEEAFGAVWSLLRPGGRFVLVDVHADPLGFQGRMVNLMARADIRRRTWTELERLGSAFEKQALPPNKDYGGELYLAAADKPA